MNENRVWAAAIECNVTGLSKTSENSGRSSRGERMKRAAIVIAVLGMCIWSWGQDKPATQGAAGQAAATAPQGKRPPAAKTQPEFDAYKAAMALPDAAASEKAADDFAAKFPDSELRAVLYKLSMQKYQAANNGDKMEETARKALGVDPDDPEALVAVAQVIAERTLVTVDTDVPVSGYPPEKIDQFKRFIKSEAYSILGTLASNAKNYPEAEANLKKSIDAFPEQVDSVAVLRMAVALDMQNKISDALKYANQAVDLTKEHPDSAAGKAARAE